jgi:glutathione S-transferase
LAPAEYKALHPSETAPVITDGDLVLGESGAIVDYILTRHGNRLSPDSDHPEIANYLYWFHFANGSMMPRIMTELIVSRVGEGGGGMMRAFGSRAAKAFQMVEERLNSTPIWPATSSQPQT